MSKISVKNDLSQWNASETIRYACRARTMERVLPPLAEPTGGNPQVRSSYIQRIYTYIQAFWLLYTILDFRFSAYVRRYISHWSRSKWSRVRYERYCLIGEKNSTAQDDRKLLGISRLKNVWWNAWSDKLPKLSKNEYVSWKVRKACRAVLSVGDVVSRKRLSVCPHPFACYLPAFFGQNEIQNPRYCR